MTKNEKRDERNIYVSNFKILYFLSIILGLFTIDKYTGQVITDNQIDREIEGSTIILHIIALIGQDKMSGTKVKITLQDENDSKPVFDPNLKIVLSEAYLPGHKIGFAKATDADLNSILTYSLSLPTQNFLNIDAQSGELTMTSSIDRSVFEFVKCNPRLCNP